MKTAAKGSFTMERRALIKKLSDEIRCAEDYELFRIARVMSKRTEHQVSYVVGKSSAWHKQMEWGHAKINDREKKCLFSFFL